MKKIITILFSFLLFAITVNGQNMAQLKYEPLFILKQILKHKDLAYKPEIPFPDLFFASKTQTEIFQEDIFPQWGFKPDFITNVYVAHSNHIYISDDQSYYDEMKRCMDDSLAHELTHYIQYKYRGWDLNDDSLEWDAIDTQTWFRENHCQDQGRLGLR